MAYAFLIRAGATLGHISVCDLNARERLTLYVERKEGRGTSTDIGIP